MKKMIDKHHILLEQKYTLVICEKPNVAKRIAQALSTSSVKKIKIDNNLILDVTIKNNSRFLIVSSMGHLYNLKAIVSDRKIFPVFDLQWSLVHNQNRDSTDIINLIERLSINAEKFIHACDYDQEGELIGYNILQLACKNKYDKSFRVKLSTLANSDIINSFNNLERTNKNLAYAGMFRHLLDFIFGINFSRAVTRSIKFSNSKVTLTVGRVQTPTLQFIVSRENVINNFIPSPFWTIKGYFEKNKNILVFHYGINKILNLYNANLILNECKGRDGIINDIVDKQEHVKPLHPFNLGDLQKEAFRLFRLSPSYTLYIAEKLYLQAVISYPRTNSQILPKSINYRKILNKLAGFSDDYQKTVSSLLSKVNLYPNNGIKNDPAHPAIYPTGILPSKLKSVDFQVYDLIVKRFFATFGDSLVLSHKIVSLLVNNNHNFNLEHKIILSPGWTDLYHPVFYQDNSIQKLPNLKIGDKLINIDIIKEDKFTEPPKHFNYSSLLTKMETEHIGTKSTRSNIIDILIERKYVQIVSNNIRATHLGMFLIDFLDKHIHKIVSPKLTRTLEKYLEDIEFGIGNRIDIMDEIIDDLLESLREVKNIDLVTTISNTVTKKRKNTQIIGNCPLCRTGNLKIIRSKKTRKRFIACSNYLVNGCKAISPLPQRGIIKSVSKICSVCNWPFVNVFYPRNKYGKTFCVNINCPTKSIQIQ